MFVTVRDSFFHSQNQLDFESVQLDELLLFPLTTFYRFFGHVSTEFTLLYFVAPQFGVFIFGKCINISMSKS